MSENNGATAKPDTDYGIARFFDDKGGYLFTDYVPFPFSPRHFRAVFKQMDTAAFFVDDQTVPSDPTATREEYFLNDGWHPPTWRKDECGHIVFIPGWCQYIKMKMEAK
jgi:hypothetical protein